MTMTEDLGYAAFNAYVVCALWASGEEFDNYSIDDLAAETYITMKSDVENFVRENSADLAGLDSEQVGHDFWLTRNGHGAGFWDRGLGKLGVRLTAATKHYGEQSLYVGGDGKLYLD